MNQLTISVVIPLTGDDLDDAVRMAPLAPIVKRLRIALDEAGYHEAVTYRQERIDAAPEAAKRARGPNKAKPVEGAREALAQMTAEAMGHD